VYKRQTQARRQPGSAFKPFVYLAALEAGYTPASIVLDAPVVIDQGPGQPPWRPENYSQRFYGPSTLRLGIEKSRNLMTVRLAQELGMERVVDLARRLGVGQGLQPLLANALGSTEVTPLALTTAYAMLVNGGRRLEPFLVERIQDRYGQTVFRRDQRACESCAGLVFTAGAAPPALPDTREQVVDRRLAYQMVSMLEGVVERGTATAARRLGRPLAGKTGTTNDSKDAWFIGSAPDLVVGVYVGYDQPASLGERETGASMALPVWIEIIETALGAEPPIPFRTPAGLNLVRIDATTGMLPGAETREVIAEAFLPGTEPRRSAARLDEAPRLTGPATPGGAPPPPSTRRSPGGIY
jgi:penicillin-binding protein 1A